MGLIESVSLNPDRRKQQQQVTGFFYDVYKNTVAVITGAANNNNPVHTNNNVEVLLETSGEYAEDTLFDLRRCQPHVVPGRVVPRYLLMEGGGTIEDPVATVTSISDVALDISDVALDTCYSHALARDDDSSEDSVNNNALFLIPAEMDVVSSSPVSETLATGDEDEVKEGSNAIDSEQCSEGTLNNNSAASTATTKKMKPLGRFYSLREAQPSSRPKVKQTLDDCALYKASLYVKVGEYLTMREEKGYKWRPNVCWCDVRPSRGAFEYLDCDLKPYATNNSQDCQYTCHQRCRGLVTLDCTVPAQLDVSPAEEAEQLLQVQCDVSVPPDVPNKELSPSALTQRINHYNTVSPQGFEMIMEEDDVSFRGFIRVHMNLSRPINVVAGTRPPSIYNILHEEEDSCDKTLTSFYLPRDTVKALHITSEMTTQGVITGLLKKFKVVDNPHKFALYERVYETGETNKVVMRRLHDHEKPLWLALLWVTDGLSNRKFFLQENDTGDIPWDAFTYPELNNFLRILDREEQEYLNQVRQRYKKLQATIQKLLDGIDADKTPTEDEDLDLIKKDSSPIDDIVDASATLVIGNGTIGTA